MTTYDKLQIRRFFELILPNSQTGEIRSPKTRQQTKSGYFNNIDKAVEAVLPLSGNVPAVYITLNPVNPALLSRAANRIKDYADNTTSDSDIVCRKKLLIDIDANRPAGISSTDSQHEAAIAKAKEIYDYLLLQSFPAGSMVLADSGNGAHILLNIDLPNTPDITKLIKTFLEALAFRFNDDTVSVDLTTFNAARISKVYGTLACKGDNTPERPWRIGRLISVPENIVTADIELIKSIADTLPKQPQTVPQDSYNGGGHTIDVIAWTEKYMPDNIRQIKDWNGGKLIILKQCINNSEHNRGEAVIGQHPNGALFASCKHSSCSSVVTWSYIRQKYEPKIIKAEPVIKSKSTTTTTLDDVLNLFKQYYYLPDTGHIELILASIAANMGQGDPVWLLLVAPPGWGKTEPLNTVIDLPHIHPVAVLTEASLLSGTPRKDKAKDAKGGLLAEMGDYGIMLIKDFSGMLSLNKDARSSILAALREIYDGAWTRYVGVEGGRKLEWKGKCGLIGAATPSIDSHYAVMAILGERFCYYRMPESGENERAAKALEFAGRETNIRKLITDKVTEFFSGLEIIDELPILSEQETKKLIALSIFTVRCRSAVECESFQSREIQNIPGIESPTRIIKVFVLIFRGLLNIGIDRMRAWELIERISLSSMPMLRQSVLIKMLKNNKDKDWENSKLASDLGYPSVTTRRSLEDMTCYGVIDRIKQGEGNADIWRLTDWTIQTYKTAFSKVTDLIRNSEGIYTYIKTLQNSQNSISDKVTTLSLPIEPCTTCGANEPQFNEDCTDYICGKCHKFYSSSTSSPRMSEAGGSPPPAPSPTTDDEIKF